MSPIHERPFGALGVPSGSDRIVASPALDRRAAGLGAALAGLLLPMIAHTRANQLLRILRPGVLRVGTYFVNPPFEFISRGTRVGFELDLMEAIARRLDLRAEFLDTRWESIFREMQESRYDCIVGGITITPDRQRMLAWSVPYMTTTLSLVVDSRRSPAAMTLADLKKATVGVQAATTDYDAAVAMQRAGQIGGVRVYPFSRIANAISDLTAGRIGAVMKVCPVAVWFVRQTPGLHIWLKSRMLRSHWESVSTRTMVALLAR